jgi:hypothetical protein
MADNNDELNITSLSGVFNLNPNTDTKYSDFVMISLPSWLGLTKIDQSYNTSANQHIYKYNVQINNLPKGLYPRTFEPIRFKLIDYDDGIQIQEVPLNFLFNPDENIVVTCPVS